MDSQQITLIPNQHPSLHSNRIAIIGECPGKDEAYYGRPFTGLSGNRLNELLSKANIVRDSCFIGNIIQVFDPSGIVAFDWSSDAVQGGLRSLTNDLQRFQPNIVVCLGATALHVFLAGAVPWKFKKHKNSRKPVYPNSIDAWRGSLFLSHPSSPLPDVKCIASLHPAYCLRQFSQSTLLMFDLLKAKEEMGTKELTLPQRDFDIHDPHEQTRQASLITDYCAEIEWNKQTIACDIEGYWHSVTCISIATSKDKSFIIPFANCDGSSYWQNPQDELEVWRALASLMANPAVPKIWQNGLYDRFCLQYGCSIMVYGNTDDTMLKSWEKYCELDKSLSFLCSILTREPYYKSDRTIDDTSTHYRYCCKDSCVTYEINDRLTPLVSFNASSHSHYRFNHDLLNPLLYMEVKGIRYDIKEAAHRLESVLYYIYGLQHSLDLLVQAPGIHDYLEDRAAAESFARSIMCHKNKQRIIKKEYESDFQKILNLLYQPTPSPNDLGYINTVLGLSVNIKSPSFKTLLYDTLKLPKQYDPITHALTTDYEALLKIQHSLQTNTKNPLPPNPIVELAIQIGSLRTRAQMLTISADSDERVRAGYNLVGSETGRITCYTSPTGSGYNLQTIPKPDEQKESNHPLRNGMRDLFLPDEGYYFFELDLSGADGWTVGANMAALGDPTMLDDLRAGIKPAQVVCYILRHGPSSINGKSRSEIKELIKEVKSTDWDYFACKVLIWGFCYLLGIDKAIDLVLINSEGRIALNRSQGKELQEAVFARYHVKLWHRAMTVKLSKSPTLLSPSGHLRRFYGRPPRRDLTDGGEILGQALAHEPQSVTTYATNLAMHNLWKDEDNRIHSTDRLSVPSNQTSDMRTCSSELRIQPLHQVHDALAGQFRITDTQWAISKLKHYFNNPITIAGQTVTIPFEGTYGNFWGDKVGHI